MTETKLRSTDPDNTDNLVGCFEASDQTDHFPDDYQPSLRSHFEHGQWWIQDTPSGASWSVNDAEQNGEEYYDFELVDHGDEDVMVCCHEWGEVEIARLTGNPHRKCQVVGCDVVSLDLNDDDDDTTETTQ